MITTAKKKQPTIHTLKEYNKRSTHRTIQYEYPKFTYLMLSDLMKCEDYSEIEISYAAGIPLDSIREIIRGNRNKISTNIFYRIFGLYARVYCDWTRFPSPPIEEH